MTNILPPTAKIELAYKQSIYQAGPVITKINQYPIGLSEHYACYSWVMLSACNPGGRKKPWGWNKRMMDRLREYIKHYPYFEGQGSLKEVSEPLFMVNIPLSKGICLARKFRQNAVVFVKYQHLSRLVYLS
ncbi:DUF3293 domain-containing protein [Commensalibacter oyaizuii]|uniref:DUF3293 domain-containing protein n=1 Tax=Commensalibacter oyaizuii TaxID=3043873 RepID=A0ABT6Q0C2_9PROT|nr:DUF3293 domain-containing protein [Commensalibacter sp. TBRC 16381]MDI2090553.1 DUF3293 domain-containing protein [Commensalibacter sp. TBRC 16381]